MTRSGAATTALQKCLALEHHATFLYAYLGARVPAATKAARHAFGNHRYTRDRILALLHAGATAPVVPGTDGELPSVRTLADAEKAALALERQCAEAYLALVAVTDGDDRVFAIDTLRKAALAELVWGGTPSTFPGMPA